MWTNDQTPAPSPTTGKLALADQLARARRRGASDVPGPVEAAVAQHDALGPAGADDRPLEVADRGERARASPRAGAGSSGSSSVLTGPPLAGERPAGVALRDEPRARRPPRPAASRWSVPSVRSRLVCAKSRSKWRRSSEPDSAVSWWTITSGSAAATARATASGSSASATTGVAPSARTASRREALRVIPTTSWPRATSRGTSCVPRAPVAPAPGSSWGTPLVGYTSCDETAARSVTGDASAARNGAGCGA